MFPVAETDGEVSLRFQARTCPQDQKGLVKERGRRDGSACANKTRGLRSWPSEKQK